MKTMPLFANVSASVQRLSGHFALIACALLLGTPLQTLASTIMIDFDSVNVSDSAGVDPTAYLATYGVTLSGVSPSDPIIYSDQYFYGGGVVDASSGHNFLLQQSAVNGGSFTLNFATGLEALSFTRIANITNNAVGFWSATAYSGATALSTVSEAYGLGGKTPVTYSFSGPNITSVVISGNGYGYAGISSAMIDDIKMTAVPDTSSTLGLLLLAGGTLAAARRKLR